MVITFYILAALALIDGLGVIFSRHPVAAAMSLLLCFLSIAGLYLTLEAELLAVIQVLVYAGAIIILFLFVILLVDQERFIPRGIALFSLPASLLVIALAAAWACRLLNLDLPESGGAEGTGSLAGSGSAVGHILFRCHVFPFEALSVLLLAAMIGAVILAKKKGVK